MIIQITLKSRGRYGKHLFQRSRALAPFQTQRTLNSLFCFLRNSSLSADVFQGASFGIVPPLCQVLFRLVYYKSSNIKYCIRNSVLCGQYRKNYILYFLYTFQNLLIYSRYKGIENRNKKVTVLLFYSIAIMKLSLFSKIRVVDKLAEASNDSKRSPLEDVGT